ncbi:protein translocase subunit SecD [Alphaproteobacteria bacterium]|jgi:preprotein translocase subunit SecD|nr:protein translocase subunit SecD [Alphaproteobacteria bacterium]
MLRLPLWQTIMILGVIVVGILLAAPNFGSREDGSSIVPGQTVNLGLDLRGGAYLLLKVDTDKSVDKYMRGLEESGRLSLRSAKVKYFPPTIEEGRLIFKPRDPELLDKAGRALISISNDVLVSLDQENQQVVIEMPEDQQEALITDIIAQTIETVRLRLDPNGVREISIQRQGTNRVLIQLPGVEDTTDDKKLLTQTAELWFSFLNENVSSAAASIPADSVIMESYSEEEQANPETYVVKKRQIIVGDMLVDARQDFNEGRPVVAFRFNGEGGRKFCTATRDNVNKRFAIVLDSRVISAPVIQSAICGGSGIISGQFTIQGAKDLAILMNAGSLPAPVVVLEERTVGAGLGADSIKAGTLACILGFIFVLIFMALMYGSFGMFANVALIANLVLILGLLSVLQATLTLPGIAGIVLTVGMAVDANVLVFERIREEYLRLGKAAQAVKNGYSNALSTILDANITTLIATMLLFVFGSGPVQGFAVTLGLGIITSMFTALLLTRLLIGFWLNPQKSDVLPI